MGIGAGAAQGSALPCSHPEPHILLPLPFAAGGPGAALARTAAPSSMVSPAPLVNPCSPKHHMPGALADSSEILQHYFYPTVAIETSDPLTVMQPLSEALHHQLPPITHRTGGHYFGQSPTTGLQDSLAWEDGWVQQRGGHVNTGRRRRTAAFQNPRSLPLQPIIMPSPSSPAALYTWAGEA